MTPTADAAAAADSVRNASAKRSAKVSANVASENVGPENVGPEKVGSENLGSENAGSENVSGDASLEARGYSIEELVETVNAWCVEARLVPANGQVGEVLTERNVRFYRTVGILDAPLTTRGGGYAEKHRLQLMALRLLQAQGMPLRRIRELLFGRTERELRGIRDRGLEAMARWVPRWVPRGAGANSAPGSNFHPGQEGKGAGGIGLGAWASGEVWTVVPVNDEFAVICRSSQQVSAEKLRRLRAVLED